MFKTFWKHMSDETPANVDDGQVFTQPNLSLSVADILSRWERNLPLDVITRNGSYLLEGDEEDFDADDIDRMDIAEANDYLEEVSQRFVSKKDIAHNQKSTKTTEQLPSEPVSDGNSDGVESTSN